MVVPDVADERARVVQAGQRVRAAMLRLIDREAHVLATMRSRPVLADPIGPVNVQAGQVRELRARGERAVRARLREEAAWVEHALGRVRALSPRATLLRGYAIVSTEAGQPVDSTTIVSPGDAVVTMLADGLFRAEVTEVESRRESDG